MSVVRPYTPEEFRKLMQCRAFRRGEVARNRAILAFQSTMGPRIHEALALRCEDVFNSNGAIKPRVWFKKLKRGVGRVVEVPPELVPYLAAWRNRLAAQGMLRVGAPLFGVSRFVVYRLYHAGNEEIGARGDLGTHSARKLWATTTYEYWARRRNEGEPVEPLAMTAKLGGWKDLNSCARYIGLERFAALDSQRHIGGKLLGKP